MGYLSRESFERARRFLMTEARPLERALFRHHFEGASVERVVTELARFQNEDGGFGHALEPDLRTPTSSALATGIGLYLLTELDCPTDHPLVERSVVYLRSMWDAETRVWRVAPADTNEHPHAPWWHDEDGSLAERFDHFRIIPRVLILSGLWHYVPLVPAAWLDAVIEEAVGYLESVDVLGQGGGSDLEYAIKLAAARNLPQSYADRLEARIGVSLPEVVVRDPDRWDTYCLTPLRVIPSPETPGAELIWSALQRHLDYQIAHQTPAGSWDPTWTWGDVYPEAWARAKTEWRGQLTLETLMQLDAFGRLAP